MSLSFSINEIVGFQVEGTAEWRRQKAEQFPEDSRNLKAAEKLERLAQEVSELEGSEIHRRIDELNNLAMSSEVDRSGSFCEDLNESVSAELRSIGFHNIYNGAAFLEWYRDNLEELPPKHIDSDESTIVPPDLEEQVENDPAVRAAKQQYEEARAEAYAQARKTL